MERKSEKYERMTRGEDFRALAWLDENLMTREALAEALKNAGYEAFEARMLAGSTAHAARPGKEGRAERKGNFLGFWQDYGVLHSQSKNDESREVLKEVLRNAEKASGIRMPSEKEMDLFAWMRRAVWGEDMKKALKKAGLDARTAGEAELAGFDRIADLWAAMGESEENIEKLTDVLFLDFVKPDQEEEGRLRARREADKLSGSVKEGQEKFLRRGP